MKKRDESNDINYFYIKNRFFNLFFNTRKYKDLLWSKEAFVSLVLSLLMTYLLFYIAETNKSTDGTMSIITVIQLIIPVIIGGMFTQLGLTIGGLALLTGTIGENVITKINKENKIQDLMSIIFNFYFSGAITGVALICSIFVYFLTFIEKPFEWFWFVLITFLLSYITIFSIIYSIMLLGTCIRILLLKYFYLTKEDNTTN